MSRSIFMRTRTLLIASAAFVAVFPTPESARAQGLKIAVDDFGIGIGPVPRLTGIRLNIRDDARFERASGINATIWSPLTDRRWSDGTRREPVRGTINGVALGLPLTGARDINGVGLGAGLAVHGDFRGIGLAAIGMGAGRDMQGIMIAGVGVGVGESVAGIAFGGLGAGVGNNVTGAVIGGLGAGVGNSVKGVALGGLGVGVGSDLDGLAFGGLGVGAGNDITGIVASVGGIGAGNNLRGLSVAGLGIGAGNDLRWVSVAGLGVGAPAITGFAAALAVGGVDVEGLILAPAYFRIEDRGELRGVVVSAYNDIRGTQRGLAIGLINIADELHGVQIGLINIARNKRSFRILPILNYSR